jgi:putative oxidoreductase
VTKQSFWLFLRSILRLVIGSAFIYSGLLKMSSPLLFTDSISSYRMLPSNFVTFVALGLPPLEIVSGLLVVTGLQIRLGLMTICSSLLIFSLAIFSTIIRGLKVDCGCFGADSWLDSNSWVALTRDVLLLCASGYLYRHYLSVQGSNSISQSKPISNSTTS